LKKLKTLAAQLPLVSLDCSPLSLCDGVLLFLNCAIRSATNYNVGIFCDESFRSLKSIDICQFSGPIFLFPLTILSSFREGTALFYVLAFDFAIINCSYWVKNQDSRKNNLDEGRTQRIESRDG